MIDITNIHVLLGAFIPFFASFIWVLILILSLYDSKTKQEQQIKRVSLLFFATFSLGCLLPILAPYNVSELMFLAVYMPIVFAWIPITGYHLIWYMTQPYEGHTFPCAKHYFLPLTYLLIWMVAELFDIQLWSDFVKEYENYIYVITALLFAIPYLLLTLIRIRKYWRALDAKTREQADAKRWHRFATKAAPVITLSVVVILFPHHTTPWFVIYLALMFSFIFISSYLCYCSVFLGLTRLNNPIISTDFPTEFVPEIPRRVHRKIAKVTKNANGKMAMEPLTRRRFDEYMKKQKPYLDCNLKMTDLEQGLCANRTVISNFVNRTYGMNFNRYINHLRIIEVHRLQKRASSDRYTLTELVRKAGFNATRTYARALAIENGDTQNEEEQV